MPGDIHGRSLYISRGQRRYAYRRNRDNDRLPARHRNARIHTDVKMFIIAPGEGLKIVFQAAVNIG